MDRGNIASGSQSYVFLLCSSVLCIIVYWWGHQKGDAFVDFFDDFKLLSLAPLVQQICGYQISGTQRVPIMWNSWLVTIYVKWMYMFNLWRRKLWYLMLSWSWMRLGIEDRWSSFQRFLISDPINLSSMSTIVANLVSDMRLKPSSINIFCFRPF